MGALASNASASPPICSFPLQRRNRLRLTDRLLELIPNVLRAEDESPLATDQDWGIDLGGETVVAMATNTQAKCVRWGLVPSSCT
jgi:hypothetical protein